MGKLKQNKKIKNIIILVIISIIIFTIGFLCFGNIEDGQILNRLLAQNEEQSENDKLADSEKENENEEFDYGTQKGKVIINYIDEDGNVISNQEEIEGIVGTEYETTRKEISHYKTNGEEPINKSGNYKKDDTVVTYVYESTENAITSTSENNQVTVKIANEKQNREYKLKIIQEAEDGGNLTGGEFILKNKENTELVNGMTTNGVLVLGTINVSEEGEETYFIEEKLTPEGYNKVLDTDLGIKITKKWNEEEKKFEIEIETDNTNQNITVEKTENDEIIVKLKNEEIKTYNLALKKFVASVDGVETGKEILAVVDEEGNIIYSEADEDIKVNKGQKVVFTIRVFNEGNQEMKVGMITDIIPTGLKLAEESEINEKYGWKEIEDTLQSEYLAEKTIKGVNISKNEQPLYEDVQIECEVTGEAPEDNKINTESKIDVDERESNKEDNKDNVAITLIPEEIKKYDLSIKKFIDSIAGAEQEREITATKNEEGEIEYTSNQEVCKVSNSQNIVYTLRVFNLEDEATLGREVYEYIPEGLEFVEESKINKENEWKMYSQDKAGNLTEVEDIKDADILKSEKLLEETIEGYNPEESEEFKYVDLQIEFKVNEDKLENEERIITNKAKMETSLTDPDDENDETEEKAEVSKFDLNLTKYIESMRINTGVYEQKVYIGKEGKNKVYKKEIDSKKINSSEIYVTYILNVKNIGDIAGYASEISDYVPNDFKLVDKDGIWEQKGNVIKTNTLAKELIEPGEEQEIEVTFKWDLTEDNIGQRTNKAIISEYQNDYDAKDLTEDEENESTFIISIKTGALRIAVITIIIALMIVAGVIKFRTTKK